MNLSTACTVVVLLGTMISVGCGERARPQDEKGGAAAGTPTQQSSAGANADIVFEPAVAPKLAFQTVENRPFTRPLQATGKVHFNEDQTARVLAPLAGSVTDLKVRVGDHVERGQVLFTLRSRELASLLAEYRETERDVDLAEKTFRMSQDLFEHQAASRISLQQAENELEKARTRLARAAESARVYGIDPKSVDPNGTTPDVVVRSPIAGAVTERQVTAGQFVQPEFGPLLTIADLSSVWVLADVFERDIRHVKPGVRAEVATTAYPDARFAARVVRIHDVVDPETRTLKVRFLAQNPGGSLKPEMFASVSLFLGTSEPAPAIPAQALFTESDATFVYVRNGENSLVRRRVETAEENGGRLRVTQGVVAGDQVVSQG